MLCVFYKNDDDAKFKKFLPEYEKAAQQLTADGLDIVLGKVNCDTEPNLCLRFKRKEFSMIWMQ